MSTLGLVVTLVSVVVIIEALKLYGVGQKAATAKPATSPNPNLPGWNVLNSYTEPTAQASPQTIAAFYNAILQAGGTVQQAFEGTAIALTETGGTLNAKATGVNDCSQNPNIDPAYCGTTDRGVFQFNSKAFAQIPDAVAYDLQQAIHAFVSLGTLAPWQAELCYPPNCTNERAKWYSVVQQAIGQYSSQPA